MVFGIISGMKKKKISVFLFVLSLILLVSNFNITLTGNIIGDSFLNSKNIFQVLGLGLLIASILMMVSKKSLDYLIIPTGQDKENTKRAERALKEWDKNYINKIVISGDTEKSLKDSEREIIYGILREHKIKPKEIFFSGGKDSKENLKYFFQKLGNLKNKVKNIGVVSYFDHLDRFEDYFKEAKQEGKIPKNIKFHRIETDETLKEEAYGKLAKLKDKYSFLKYLNNKTFVGSLIKKIVGG